MRFWKREPTKTPTPNKPSETEYFEMPRPDGNGLCSDNACPCGDPGTVVPRGTGYLFISDEVVRYRRNARSVNALNAKLRESQRLVEQRLGAFFEADPATYNAILCCRKAAIKRNLNLDVAAADAEYWWKTGLVPLRATPKW